MVLSSRQGQDSRPFVKAFLKRVGAEVVAFNEVHQEAALNAFLRFGKGRHPAGLNLADCMTYAIASVAGQRLLYVGEDFARTDMERAV
jgi:ribonuclease VapC